MELHDSQKARRHAVVLGGSLAGLLAARVLSDYFERVTIIERDIYPTKPEARRGTPQASHVHGLMPRGRMILEQLFPGLQKEMMSWGAPLVDMAKDVAWLTPQGWGVNFKSNIEVLSFTRPLLDLHLRKRLINNPRILFMEDTKIVELIKGDDDNVAGIMLRVASRNGDQVGIRLPADLVVDTTGRASRAPEWLKSLGYDAPEEITVNAHLGYASRLYEISADFNADWTCTFVQTAPPKRKRGGILFSVEGNRWLVTLVGGGRDYPPQDEEGFLEFARSLRASTIYDAIRDAKPLSSIKVHRGTENRLRQFDKLSRQPRNFIALGDSVCAFNPVYGQGMSIAAMGAMTLHECLQKWQTTSDFSARFQKELAKVTDAPWMLATSEDYRYEETEGGTATLRTRFMHRYMNQVLKLATFDANVRHVLLQAFGMLVPPTALLRPRIVLRVVRHLLLGSTQLKNKSRRGSTGRLVYDSVSD